MFSTKLRRHYIHIIADMNAFSASLLKGRLVFGKYPTPEEAQIVEDNQYTHVVNLTCPEEITWNPIIWSQEIKYITYPFRDGQAQIPVAGWDSFEPFLRKIIRILENRNNKIYILCFGGHGRSATISAILYGKIKNVDSEEAINRIYRAHQRRTEMKPKWRKLGSPQREKQKDIIRKYLNGIEDS